MSARNTTTPERSQEMVFQALAAADVPYRYGGQSHATGFDCSGLVAHVYREAFGIVLPHNTRAQSETGTKITREDLQPGDLVFYNTQGKPYSHVGIYLGDGRFIHAPKTGSAVRVEDMHAGYWAKRYNGARRIEGI
jgi:cell wall-associated NlpC family hydrolase